MPPEELLEYREIAGSPRYRIGNDGSLWSCNYPGANGEWRPLIGGIDKDGYRKAILCNGGERRHVRVHAIVLEAFVGPRPEGMVGAHNDGVLTNNRLSNLRWDTQKSNIADKVEHGTQQIGEKSTNVILTEPDVLAIRQLRSEGLTYEALGKRFGIAGCTAHAVVKRRNWKHVP